MKVELPSPGDIVLHDFRGETPPKHKKTDLKIVQWNIERGYQLQGIIQQLKQLDPDIIGLQEIDIQCERSGNLDVGVEIAKALKMHYAFVCEFVEIHSKKRSLRDQGGGVHGNAILSRYDIISAEGIKHTHHPIDWTTHKHPKARSEPRRGERMTLCCLLAVQSTPLVMYSCHLEVFCGVSDRLYQFGDILQDSRIKSKAGHDRQIILGDLNTMANGIARLLPNFCTDHLRFRTLGIQEATFWKKNLFHVTDADKSDLVLDDQGHWINRRLMLWGLDSNRCRYLINPGFQDPFDTEKDITLSEPRTGRWNWRLVTGKLDWVLLKKMIAKETLIGNHGYLYSDHKWLMVTTEWN